MRRSQSAQVAPTTATRVWGGTLEAGRFLKVPKIIFYLGRYDRRMGSELQPRHLLLLLALAARKYGDEEIRAYWAELASGLGVRAGTVRKWGYELRDMGLLRIENRRRSASSGDGDVSGNERNAFDIAPFIRLLKDAHETWMVRPLSKPEDAR